MELEWDEAKRESNLAKHGLDLTVSLEFFADYSWSAWIPAGIMAKTAG